MSKICQHTVGTVGRYLLKEQFVLYSEMLEKILIEKEEPGKRGPGFFLTLNRDVDYTTPFHGTVDTI